MRSIPSAIEIVLAVGALALAACDQGYPKVSDRDCGTAVDALIKSAPGEQMADVRAPLVARCRDDRWTREAVTCMSNATDDEAQRACRSRHFTRKQAEKLEQAEMPSNAVIMAKMLEYEDRMCACKDAECATRVGDAMTLWTERLAKQQSLPPNMTEAEAKRATAITDATFECWTRELSPRWFSLEPDHGDAKGGTSVKLMAASQFAADDAKTAKIYFGDKLGKVIRVVSSEELLVEAPGGKAGETVDVVLELQGIDRGGREEVPHSFRFVNTN